MIKVVVLLAKNILVPLASMSSESAIDGAIQRKMYWWRIVRAGKGTTWIISNEDMDDIIRIIESLENSSVLIDGFSETVKHEIKKQERRFLSMLLRPLGASVRKYFAWKRCTEN